MVVDDVDATLADLATASAAMDRMTAEAQSENGGDEVDTIELVFACPPNSGAPSHGLGAKCTPTSQCNTGLVCDLANGGGTCAPDPATAAIGTRCTTTQDCGTDPRSVCQTEAGDGFPGGYCFMEPCDAVQVCPPGATCVALGGETPGCMKTCANDDDCVRQPARIGERYVCQVFSVTPPTGFGPSDHACSFPCTRDVDCNAPMTCDVPSGHCKP
jgi:hypothetical protein